MPRVRSKLVRTVEEKPRARDSDEAQHRERGLGLRLLICNLCRSVWPTERDEAHGGSRSDGEPCAYRWPDGKVCKGTVHAGDGTHWRPRDYKYEKEAEAAYRVYAGGWCKVFGLPWGTTNLSLVRKRYRELAKLHHPDAGGDHAKMVEINEAYRQALSELGQAGG